jgi:2-methylcitrate dehydratase PrpD
MKKYCVGFPIQSAMEALLLTVDEHGYKADDVEAIEARILKSGAHTVNDREMPDINLQYCFAVALIDGAVSFAAAHDDNRLHNDPAIAALKKKVTLIGDDSFGEGKYQASVAVTLKDGKTVSKHAESFRGKSDNPMSTDEVEAKARDLIEPVMGSAQTERLIETVRDLDSLDKARDLRPLLSVRG